MTTFTSIFAKLLVLFINPHPGFYLGSSLSAPFISPSFQSPNLTPLWLHPLLQLLVDIHGLHVYLAKIDYIVLSIGHTLKVKASIV